MHAGLNMKQLFYCQYKFFPFYTLAKGVAYYQMTVAAVDKLRLICLALFSAILASRVGSTPSGGVIGEITDPFKMMNSRPRFLRPGMDVAESIIERSVLRSWEVNR